MSHIHRFGTQPEMLDEPHLKPYEPAARHYCGALGVDPDGVTEIEHPPGRIVAGPLFRPAWAFAADKLIDLSRMLNALQAGALAQAAANKAH